MLSPELTRELSAERFEREITVAAQLQHANIVPLLAAGAVDGLPYFTMPFVEGQSLRSRMARGALPLVEIAGHEVDTRADLYAWGVIAYELLAGHHPFHNKTTSQQLIAAHIAETSCLLVPGGAGGAGFARDAGDVCLEQGSDTAVAVGAGIGPGTR